MNTRLTTIEKEESENLYKNYNYTFIDVARKLGRDERSIRKYLNSIGYFAKSQSELQRKYPLQENFFDIVDTEEKAYILGLFYADGYNNTNKNDVCISLKEDDVELLNKITEIIQPTKPLFYLDMSYENRGMKNTKNQYRLTINNKHISQRLVELGCGKAKTSNILFPNLKQVPSNLIHHFVRGYFDGDGSISKGKYPKIDMVSTPEFLLTLQKLINKELDINITKLNWNRKYIEANICSLQIGGRLQCIRFMEWIYKDATIFLERKRKVFDKYYKTK
jgi:intein/homing endonuclease